VQAHPTRILFGAFGPPCKNFSTSVFDKDFYNRKSVYSMEKFLTSFKEQKKFLYWYLQHTMKSRT
jgi:hypothetical protein